MARTFQTDRGTLVGMRIGVFGVGGVGGFFGGRLTAAGTSVAFISRGATLDALRRDGLRVGAADQVAAIHGVEHVLDGMCRIVSFVVEPGLIRHYGGPTLRARGPQRGGRPSRPRGACADPGERVYLRYSCAVGGQARRAAIAAG